MSSISFHNTWIYFLVWKTPGQPSSKIVAYTFQIQPRAKCNFWRAKLATSSSSSSASFNRVDVLLVGVQKKKTHHVENFAKLHSKIVPQGTSFSPLVHDNGVQQACCGKFTYFQQGGKTVWKRNKFGFLVGKEDDFIEGWKHCGLRSVVCIKVKFIFCV